VPSFWLSDLFPWPRERSLCQLPKASEDIAEHLQTSASCNPEQPAKRKKQARTINSAPNATINA